MASVSRYLSNTFVRGTLLFTAATFSGGLLNYLFNLIVAKKLGPAGFGEISTLFSYTTIFSVPMTVIAMVIIQKIGSNKHKGQSYAFTLEKRLIAKLKKWWFALLLLLFLSPIIQKLTNLSFQSSISLVPFIMLSFIGAFYIALLQGLHMFRWLSIVGLTAIALKLTGAIAIRDSTFGVLLILIFLFISGIATVLGSTIALRRLSATHAIIKSKLNKRILDSLFQKQVIITFLSILGITLLSNADVVTAKKFLPSYQAGIYGAWSLFAKIILYFMGPLITSGYIFFSSRKNKQNHERVLNFSLLFIAVLGALSFALYSSLSLPLIHLLFGHKFNSIASVLGFAGIFGSVYAATTLINNYFLSKKSVLCVMPFVVGLIYTPSLYFFGRSMNNLIAINLFVGCLLLLLQIGSLVKYNTDNGQAN